jgi:hypothetical protein
MAFAEPFGLWNFKDRLTNASQGSQGRISDERLIGHLNPIRSDPAVVIQKTKYLVFRLAHALIQPQPSVVHNLDRYWAILPRRQGNLIGVVGVGVVD